MPVDLLHTATRLVTETRFGSPSMLVRRLKNEHGVRITFATARDLLEQMHHAGVVGPDRGATAREVLMDPEVAASAITRQHGSDWFAPSRPVLNAADPLAFSPDAMTVTY